MDFNIINLHFPRPKWPKAFLEKIHNKIYNLEKTQSKPIKYQNSQGILGTKNIRSLL
jgi:hypothetical protein